MTHDDRQGGFTLLELIVVLTIISVMLAVIAPRLAGRGQAARLRSAGFEVQTLATAARARAVLTGQVVGLMLSGNGRELRLIRQGELGADEKEISLVDLLPRRRLPAKTRASFHHEDADEGEPDLIRFRPDGSAEGGELRVVDEQGEELFLRLLEPLGRLQLAEAKSS